jgi:hypothetical protein
VIGSRQNDMRLSLDRKINFHKTKTIYLITGKLESGLQDQKKIAMYQLIDRGKHLNFF